MPATSKPPLPPVGGSGTGSARPPWEAAPPLAGGPPWEAARPLPGGPPWEVAPPGPGGPPRQTAPPATGEPPRVSGGHPGHGQRPVTGPGADGEGEASDHSAGAGGLIRRQGSFARHITRDGSSGFPAEQGRYQLYASLACPWSQRALIVCRLLGLDRVIGLTLTDPVTDSRGWHLGEQNARDPVTGARYLSDLYRATDPRCQGPFLLPLLWDSRSQTIVSDDVADITVMLETEFRQFHLPGSPDLYPQARRREIESLATLIYHTVNVGVYRAGRATTQPTYDQAVDALFTTLDALDDRLSRRRYLLGDQLTEADIRLYPTLVRFDSVYYQLFNCNLRRLSDYRHLWAYTRDLHSQPGFGETTDMNQIKNHYYQSPEWGNRSKIVPAGPLIDWNEPHGRTRMTA